MQRTASGRRRFVYSVDMFSLPSLLLLITAIKAPQGIGESGDKNFLKRKKTEERVTCSEALVVAVAVAVIL